MEPCANDGADNLYDRVKQHDSAPAVWVARVARLEKHFQSSLAPLRAWQRIVPEFSNQDHRYLERLVVGGESFEHFWAYLRVADSLLAACFRNRSLHFLLGRCCIVLVSELVLIDLVENRRIYV